MIRLRRKSRDLSDPQELSKYIGKLIKKYLKKCGTVTEFVDEKFENSKEVKVNIAFEVKDSLVAIKSIYKMKNKLIDKGLKVYKEDLSEKLEHIVFYIVHKDYL